MSWQASAPTLFPLLADNFSSPRKVHVPEDFVHHCLIPKCSNTVFILAVLQVSGMFLHGFLRSYSWISDQRSVFAVSRFRQLTKLGHI
jgi:hypothetical protein